MGLNLQLAALTLPEGTEFPGTMQALQNLSAQYYDITGQDNFAGINYGPVTPAPENRDRPWFKTDNSFNPIGWFSWDGSAWIPIPVVPQSGSTANRPVSATVGQQYYDTDISRSLIWNGGSWVTLDGGSGEIRAVRGTDSAAILTKNPGWTLVTDIAAQVIGVAGNGTGSGFSNRSPETTVGEETHAQIQAELPAVSINSPFTPAIANGNNPNPGGGLLSLGSSNTKNLATNNLGSGTPFNVMQPTRFLYYIQKT